MDWGAARTKTGPPRALELKQGANASRLGPTIRKSNQKSPVFFPKSLFLRYPPYCCPYISLLYGARGGVFPQTLAPYIGVTVRKRMGSDWPAHKGKAGLASRVARSLGRVELRHTCSSLKFTAFPFAGLFSRMNKEVCLRAQRAHHKQGRAGCLPPKKTRPARPDASDQP